MQSNTSYYCILVASISSCIVYNKFSCSMQLVIFHFNILSVFSSRDYNMIKITCFSLQLFLPIDLVPVPLGKNAATPFAWLYGKCLHLAEHFTLPHLIWTHNIMYLDKFLKRYLDKFLKRGIQGTALSNSI